LVPLRQAVPACAAVVGGHVDGARRAALDDLRLDPLASQRAVVQRGGDGRAHLLARGGRIVRPDMGEGVRHGYSAARPLVMSLALAMCHRPAAMVTRLAFNPFAMSPVVLCGWPIR
jgi:hypothetical protein